MSEGNKRVALQAVLDMMAADVEHWRSIHENLVTACKAIRDAHDALFAVGLPLYQVGKKIEHSLLNDANRLAEIAIARAEGK